MKLTFHPDYIARVDQWTKLADCYAGSDAVKAKGDTYLRPTVAMIRDGYGQPSTVATRTIGLTGYTNETLGDAMYEAYKDRAVFHPYVSDAVRGMVGVEHRKPPAITLPSRLEPMLARASNKGETIEHLWRRISEFQLCRGRCGLAVDLPTVRAANAVPFIALYAAESILNWQTEAGPDGRERVVRVVLDESRNEMQPDLTWQWVPRVRVMTTADRAALIDGSPVDAVGDTYVVGLFVGNPGGDITADLPLADPGWVVPSMSGSPRDGIRGVPFVFVNPTDTVADTTEPPLLGLADLTLAIYRGEADHRHTLFMQSQETLVVTGAIQPVQGEDRPVEVGAGAVINLPLGGDAKYIGVSAAGLGAQKEQLDTDKAQAANYTIQALDTKGGDVESGEALRIRASSRTASLALFQNVVAVGISDCFAHAARLVGMSDAEIDGIEVKANLDFADEDSATVADVNATLAADGPLSRESAHAVYVRKGMTTMTYEDEVQKQREEMPDLGASGGTDVEMEPVLDADGNPIMPANDNIPEAAGAASATNVAATALNGAQVQAMTQVAKDVAMREISRETGQRALMRGFLLSEAEALAMLGPEEFVPASLASALASSPKQQPADDGADGEDEGLA